MKSALIVYGSTTGNTAFVADMAGTLLGQADFNVTILDAAKATAAGLCDNYDLILFGCSTWGDDEIELQDDFIPLFDDFDNINAQNKKVGVFGCGDSSYTYYCGAVDAIEQKLDAMGATVIDTLKIDGDPQSEKGSIEKWVASILAGAA